MEVKILNLKIVITKWFESSNQQKVYTIINLVFEKLKPRFFFYLVDKASEESIPLNFLIPQSLLCPISLSEISLIDTPKKISAARGRPSHVL